MMDRSTAVPDNSNPQAPGEAQGLERGQTAPGAPQPDATIAKLNEMEAKVSNLERQLQSTQDKLTAKLQKEWRKNQEGLQRAAKIEGWSEDTMREKLQAANEQTLRELSISELETLEQAPPAQDNSPVALPPAPPPAQDPNDHAAFLRQQLAYIGLSEADLGAQGLTPFIGKEQSPELLRLWTKQTAEAIAKREKLARDLAERAAREQDAAEAAEEIEQFGNFGGAQEGAQGSAASSNVERLKQKAIQEFRNTGRVADALAARRKIDERYGG